jgi:hypothetical protein
MTAPHRRGFRWITRMLGTLFLARALRTEWHPEEQDIVPAFEAIRKRKAELDEKLFGTPKRRWFWQRCTH